MKKTPHQRFVEKIKRSVGTYKTSNCRLASKKEGGEVDGLDEDLLRELEVRFEEIFGSNSDND